MINQKDDADLKSNEIKSLLIKNFGDSISFCHPERKNQSFVFSSSIEVQDVVIFLRNIDVVKTATIEIKKINYLMLTLDLKIASVMQTSSNNLGKKQNSGRSSLVFCTFT